MGGVSDTESRQVARWTRVAAVAVALGILTTLGELLLGAGLDYLSVMWACYFAAGAVVVAAALVPRYAPIMILSGTAPLGMVLLGMFILVFWWPAHVPWFAVLVWSSIMAGRSDRRPDASIY